DFEEYMFHLGVDVDPDSVVELPEGHRPVFDHYSLLQGREILQNAKYASIGHNIRLMHHLRDETSLNKMLESARDLGDLSGLRGYIEVLEEYHPYLTQKQKLIVIKFLYEQLIMPEEDIRKQCAALLGVIIGT
ncbi:cytidyltransferase, partial [Aduncisulcus paluster]